MNSYFCESVSHFCESVSHFCENSSLVVDIITSFLVLFRHGTLFAYIVVSNFIKPKWNYAMTKQLNLKMSHNVCYRSLPSRDVVFLSGWDLHTECGKYYIRLYCDYSTGKYFYTVRDSSWSLSRRIYSVGFCCPENALVDIRSFVSLYTKDTEVIHSIPLFLKECA